jgi:ferric-dicitrate binding protein FerR (iron transport regulator)
VANEIQVLNGANIESVMAWKNGFFSFSGTSVEELMNILGRWYNVEIVFNKSIPNRQFGGQIATSANLSQVVKVLNESELKCALIDGKLVID